MSRVLLMLLGATSFWGPVTLAALVTRKGLSDLVGTPLSSATFVLSYFLLRRKYADSVRSVSGWMLLGVFLLGGVFSSVVVAAPGAGYSSPHVWEAVRWLLISLIPGWIVLYGALFLGTVPGVLLVALFTIVVHAKWERNVTKKGSASQIPHRDANG